MRARKAMFDTMESTREMDDDLRGAILIGTVSISEWLHPERGPILVVLDSNADGEPLTSWSVMGWIQAAAMMVTHRR